MGNVEHMDTPTTTTTTVYREGQVVWLAAMPENGVEREQAVILELTEMPWGTSVIAQVEPLQGLEYDDGLRECTIDQVECLVEPVDEIKPYIVENYEKIYGQPRYWDPKTWRK